MVQHKTLAEDGSRCNIGYTPQNCWLVTQLNVEEAWREYYTKYDLLEFRLPATGLNWYNTVDKIPKDKIPFYEQFYNIYFRDYFGVEYLILQQKPGVVPPPF